jgi:hypothetical protein
MGSSGASQSLRGTGEWTTAFASRVEGFLDAIAARERLLWGVVVFVLIADVLSTQYGLRHGAVEGNPLVRTAIHHAGPIALWPLKGMALVVGIMMRRAVSEPHGPVVPLGLAIPWGFAVIVNLLVISF